MLDITMCDNKECNKKETCYRYTAKPHEYWQSYCTFMGGKDCEYYWDNKMIDCTITLDDDPELSLVIALQSKLPYNL